MQVNLACPLGINKHDFETSLCFMEGFEVLTECVMIVIFLSLSCNLVMWYELNKKQTEHFVVFSNTVPRDRAV